MSEKRMRQITGNQARSLRALMIDSPTDKQVKYLRDLGYQGEIPTKLFATRKITEMKENDEK